MKPLGRFLEYSMESLESILKAPLGQTLSQKPSGPAAPRAFGLGSGLGGPSIYSLGAPLRTLGNLPRGSILHYTPSAFPQIVPFFSRLTPEYELYQFVKRRLHQQHRCLKHHYLTIVRECRKKKKEKLHEI